MAALLEKNEWVEGIYQLEETDPVQGGAEGIDNLQARQLAGRTLYLRSMFDRLFLGRPFKSWDRAPRAGFIRYDGSIHQRANYAKLVKYATDENLFVSQRLKDGDPLKYAAYFGDGDVETTFSLPNLHLGNSARGCSEFGSFLESQKDAIVNFQANFSAFASTSAVSGCIKRIELGAERGYPQSGNGTIVSNYQFNPDMLVETANEVRDKKTNVNIDAWAGE